MVEAFKNCFGALDDLDTYRAEAIPLLREKIAQFKQLTDSAESKNETNWSKSLILSPLKIWVGIFLIKNTFTNTV